MAVSPMELSLDILPSERFDIIDVNQRAAAQLNGHREQYKRVAYCSFHTTAGYLEQSLLSRLNYDKDKVKSYIKAFQHLFPTDGPYRHDQLELRTELSDAQKEVEPRNADSHLTFMGSGLKNCVTYINKPELPSYFIELDGVSQHGHVRNRKSTLLYYTDEEVVFEQKVAIPVSGHPVDSINLRDPRLGYLDKLNSILRDFDVEKGRVEIGLDPSEKNAGITVNEYETLLMQHDLVDVLHNPRKFMEQKGKYILQHPEQLRSRTKEYAKYDLVHIFNEVMDAFHISHSKVENILSRFIALPAERFLRMKRSISLLVSNENENEIAQIRQGTYQSPILVQWRSAPKKERNLHLRITRFR
jgi:thiamine phosphate synthase YjbQ (UPF0047 family)